MIRCFRSSKRFFPGDLFPSFATTASPPPSQQRRKSTVCIVGSGPAGFYTAQHLLKKNSDVKVDMLEKLPAPFGLVRYGVAPDHPEIKNVIDSFTKFAEHERFSFYGNVSVGKDITVTELLKAYNAVVLAYGAGEDRSLGISGENSKNVFSARTFVGWFNGQPDNLCEPVDLDTDVAAVVGQGNVALDVARMLLRDIDTLKKTDVAEHALEKFKKSRVKRVVLIGRRGPLQVSFTTKEFREITKLPDCHMIQDAVDFEGVTELVPSIQRPKKRLVELLLSTLQESDKRNDSLGKQLELKYYRSPKVIVPDSNNKVQSLVLGINKSEGSLTAGKIVQTDKEEILNCGLVIKSVGYKSIPIDPCIPFDNEKYIVAHNQGKAIDGSALYCSGWLKTGPTGVIPTTMNSSFETAEKIIQDFKDGKIDGENKGGSEEMRDILKSKNITITNFDDWKKIDSEEKRRGEVISKPREKICDVDEMLKIISSK